MNETFRIINEQNILMRFAFFKVESQLCQIFKKDIPGFYKQNLREHMTEIVTIIL